MWTRQTKRTAGFVALRAACFAFVLTAVTGIVSRGPFEARSRKNRKSGPPQSLPDRVNGLMRRLYGVQLVDAGNIPDQVQNLVNTALTTWMSGNGFEGSANNYPVDVRVRLQLERYFSKLHYPLFGQATVFARPWKGRQLIGAGYTLGWSDFDRVNVLALYESKAGKTRRVALAHFYPGTDLHFAVLPPSPRGGFRFITYGNRLGKSQPRLSAILYSFDGQKLNNLWHGRDLYDGKMEVAPTVVTFRYLIENEYIQAVQQGQLPQWHEDVYRITPAGFTLETQRLVFLKGAL